jgi:glyoxylase-like metal-dependent hydrolase (beta-lactamase superfamily II)
MYMNKKLKFFLVSVLSIFMLLIIAFGFLFITFKDYKASESKQIIPGVYVLKGKRVNMYLVKSPDNCIAIDAGDDMQILLQELSCLGINPEKVDAVFLTHTDGDHTAAVTLFKNAEVFISKEEEMTITGKRKRKILWSENDVVLPVSKYSIISDKDIKTFGTISVTCISTPGHTPGSMSFLINNSYLFTGDSALLKNAKLIPLGKPFTENPELNKQTVVKLQPLFNAAVITGTAHSGYILKQ